MANRDRQAEVSGDAFSAIMTREIAILCGKLRSLYRYQLSTDDEDSLFSDNHDLQSEAGKVFRGYGLWLLLQVKPLVHLGILDKPVYDEEYRYPAICVCEIVT